MSKLMYPVSEAADLCGIGRSKFYELVTDGSVKTVKVGTRRLVPAKALNDFIDQLVADADTAA